MKKLILIVFFALSFSPSFGQENDAENLKVITRFIDCIRKNKIEDLAQRVSYPLKRDYPIPMINNKQEFVKRYDQIFDANFTRTILKSNPKKDWSAVGWRGIMLNSGDLWLGYKGELIAVNYQSKVEQDLWEALVAKDRMTIHKSLRQFSRPELILQTSKYLIRIDDMGFREYRYASWKIGSKMSDAPDVIVLNGKVEFDGTGGNHCFKFTKAEYTYKCDIVEMGEEDSPPAYLVVYKGKKEILTQRATIVD